MHPLLIVSLVFFLCLFICFPLFDHITTVAAQPWTNVAHSVMYLFVEKKRNKNECELGGIKQCRFLGGMWLFWMVSLKEFPAVWKIDHTKMHLQNVIFLLVCLINHHSYIFVSTSSSCSRFCHVVFTHSDPLSLSSVQFLLFTLVSSLFKLQESSVASSVPEILFG